MSAEISNNGYVQNDAAAWSDATQSWRKRLQPQLEIYAFVELADRDTSRQLLLKGATRREESEQQQPAVESVPFEPWNTLMPQRAFHILLLESTIMQDQSVYPVR